MMTRIKNGGSNTRSKKRACKLELPRIRGFFGKNFFMESLFKIHRPLIRTWRRYHEGHRVSLANGPLERYVFRRITRVKLNRRTLRYCRTIFNPLIVDGSWRVMTLQCGLDGISGDANE